MQSVFFACVFYVDDVALLSPTIHGMQKLIDICSSYARENALKYNFKKTKVMFFGKPTRQIGQDSFKSSGDVIEIVHSWKYLGFHLSSTNGKFGFNFFNCFNSVINALYKPSEEVTMKLFFTVFLFLHTA